MENQIAIWQDQEQLKEIKELYAPNLTEGEYKTFIGIGLATGLNPFLRELWAVKYGNSAASIFIGRDGYRKAAQMNSKYDYHQTDCVYSNDIFWIKSGEIEHNYQLADRGALVGAYSIVKRKGSTKPIHVFVELKEYSTGKSLWLSKPATMIKKVAESQGLRMAFQDMFAGTYDESEQWEAKEPTKIGTAPDLLFPLLAKINAVDTVEDLKILKGELQTLPFSPEQKKAAIHAMTSKYQKLPKAEDVIKVEPLQPSQYETAVATFTSDDFGNTDATAHY